MYWHDANPDYGAAFALFSQAAAAGETYSMLDLAALYMQGAGVPKNPAKAAAWVVQSATRGNCAGIYQSGTFYRDGVAVPKSLVVAASLFRRAATMGYAPAQASLGMAYATGSGVPKDLMAAGQWLAKAAAVDSYAAQQLDLVQEALGPPLPIGAQNEIRLTANTIQDGHCLLVISNLSGKTATAYAYEVTFESPSGLVGTRGIEDALIGATGISIGPGESRTLWTGPLGLTGAVVRFHAALFSDGTESGEAAWIQRLHDRRNATRDALAALLTDLQAAEAKVASGTATLKDVADAVRSAKASRMGAPGANGDQALMVGNVHDEVLRSLDLGQEKYSPEKRLGLIQRGLEDKLARLGEASNQK